MNRREAIKTSGVALIGSLLAAREIAAAPGQVKGTFRLTMRGPSLLHFPKDGTWARLHFVAFPHASPCPQPIHPAILKMDSNTTLCTTETDGHRDKWRVDGHSVSPRMNAPFQAKEYATQVSKEGVQHPINQDWSSLRWVPVLPFTPDRSPRGKLETATNAAVFMNSGSLVAVAPHDDLAKTALWIWDKPDKWAEIEPVAATRPQQALTDQVELVGSYVDEAELTFSSLVMPTATFTMKFKPRDPKEPDIHLDLIAEPPDDPLHNTTGRPVEVYCGFYNAAVGTINRSQREVPYLSTQIFEEKPKARPEGQPAPRPLCGVGRYIE